MSQCLEKITPTEKEQTAEMGNIIVLCWWAKDAAPGLGRFQDALQMLNCHTAAPITPIIVSLLGDSSSSSR